MSRLFEMNLGYHEISFQIEIYTIFKLPVSTKRKFTENFKCVAFDHDRVKFFRITF